MNNLNELIKLIDEKRIVQIACDLMRFKSDNPSTTDLENHSNEAGIANYILDFFKSVGIEAYAQAAYFDRVNVIACLKGISKESVPSIAFNGHMDVVPAGDLSLWEHDPYDPWLKDGKLYGRGACDMKGSIACFMHVMETIKKYNIQHDEDIWFTAVIDEEKSNKGVNALLQSSFKADRCIVGEASSCEILIGHRGVLAFEIEIPGIACHAAMTATGQGRNAILDAIKAIKSIENVDIKLHEKKSEMLGCSQLNVTGFSSGIKVNVIPDKAVLQLDGRTALGEKLEDIQNLVASALDSLKDKGEILSYKIKPTTFCPSYELPLDSEFLRTAKSAAKKVGLEPKISVFGATCEASLIAKVCPEVIIFGAGSLKQAHNSNEFVPINDLIKTAHFYLSCVLENN